MKEMRVIVGKRPRPLTFEVSLSELEKYGWSPKEQLMKNPRLSDLKKKYLKLQEAVE